jgi:ribose 5-phosphate isomerase A
MIEKAPGDDAGRLAAAKAALAEVRPGMTLGLGTGRTADHFVRLLGEKVRAGLDIVGVPTSERTASLARAEGVPLTTLEDHPRLDLAVDGADEIDPELRLIKGAGGALLREKIVAAAAKRMLVVADRGKLVRTLGAVPLPVEVIPFGIGATRVAIEAVAREMHLSGEIRLRRAGDKPFVSDGGHYILDASFGRIPDPDALALALNGIPGVVEHGLFIGLASAAIVGGEDGVEWITLLRH